MAAKLYLGVEDVLVHRTDRSNGSRRGYELAPGALRFLTWAVRGFNCYWLTGLEQHGGNTRIRRAFRVALDQPVLNGEIEMLFEYVRPTYWEDCMVEALDFGAEFYWIANGTDAFSRAVLRRRGLEDRLILCSTKENADDFARIQVRLEGVYEW